ncbi:hypothetical protein GCM10028805_61160 [Spirosoma harenae]
MSTRLTYLPGITGLRAIAAVFIVLIHVLIEEIDSYGLVFFEPFPPIGQFYVTHFFVISGFLISYLLLLEKEKTGINIGAFYVRRILRIWPLYYLFIAVCICLTFFNREFEQVLSPHIYWYLFFASNIPFIFSQVIEILGHLWSIGTEEQFYAFWPWVMKRKNPKLIPSIIFIYFTLLSLKIAIYFWFGRQSQLYLLAGFLRFYPMVIGALGAVLYYKRNQLFIILASSKISQLFSWITFFTIGFGFLYVPPIIAHEVIAVVTVVIIIGQTTVKNRLVNLENNICRFLGQISYGIYIIHPLCIALFLPLLKPLQINTFAKSILGFVIVLLSTIILAHLSYNYFEKYFLRLKDKFTIIKARKSDLPVVELVH